MLAETTRDSSWFLAVDLKTGSLIQKDDEQFAAPVQVGNRLILDGDVGHINVQPGSITIDRATSLCGELYFRRRVDIVEISNSLRRLLPTPDELSIPVLLGMCLGLRPPPDQTHVSGIDRVPSLATARIIPGSTSVRASGLPTAVGNDGAPPEAVLRDAMAGFDGVVALGGLASTTLARLVQDRDGRRPRALTFDPVRDEIVLRAEGRERRESREQTPNCLVARSPWPMWSDHHFPAVAAIAAAANVGEARVLTGHHLRMLLSIGPEECRSAVPAAQRLVVESLAAHPRRQWRRRGATSVPEPHSHSPAAQTITLPPFLTEDARRALYATFAAGTAAWEDWSRGQTPRESRALWTLTDPLLGRTHDAATELGVQLEMPAAVSDTFGRLLGTAPRLRGRVEQGCFLDAPILRQLGTDAPFRTDGAHRARLAAAGWAMSAGPDVEVFARTGRLATAGIIDPAELETVMANPFLRTEHASSLRRLLELDSWLTTWRRSP